MFSVPLHAARCPMSALRLVSRVAAIGLVAVAACVRDSRFPSEPAMRRTPQFAAVASSRVVSALAAVSGLRGNAPALLGGKRGIQAVDVDQGIPLDVPRMAVETAADGGGV